MAQTGDAQGASRQLGQVQQGLATMSEQVAAANEQMTQQQEAASAQMEELSTGLEDATSGIDEIQGGLEEVQTLLGNINDNEAVDQTGLHVPEEFLETDGIKDTVDQYSFRSEEHTSELQSRFDLVC